MSPPRTIRRRVRSLRSEEERREADAAQLILQRLALLLLQPGSFPLLGGNGDLEVLAALFEPVEAVLEGFSHGAIIARKSPWGAGRAGPPMVPDIYRGRAHLMVSLRANQCGRDVPPLHPSPRLW